MVLHSRQRSLFDLQTDLQTDLKIDLKINLQNDLQNDLKIASQKGVIKFYFGGGGSSKST